MTAPPRQSYQRLARRNRLVGVLRVVVPLVGVLVLGSLVGQLVLANLSGRFGIQRLSVTPEAITVEAPEYVGALADGASYRVWAETARAEAQSSELFHLTNASLVLNRADGVQLTMEARQAQLDTARQLTLVPGIAEVADSTGTTGTLRDSIFDWHSQLLTTRGAVAIDNADGSTVRAQGLVYDASSMIWTFERSVVTLPATPGEDGPSSGEKSE